MSRPVTVDIPHQLGAAEARRRIDEGFGRLVDQIGGSGRAQVARRWEGDQMSFSLGVLGQAVSGRVHVLPETVRLELRLPGVLGVLAEAIKGRVQEQGKILLGPPAPPTATGG